MNQRGSRIILSLLACVLAGQIPTSSFAGDLDPPPGPIAPTDRVRLNAQQIALPYTIDSPGSYVLTSELVGAEGGHGIAIASEDVTLDLNGFTLRGVEGALSGVYVAGEHANIEITNGVITDWPLNGVDARFAVGGVIDRLRVSDCGGGIGIGYWETEGPQFSNGGIVRDCTVVRCESTGISAVRAALITGCRALDNGGSGISASGTGAVRDSAALRNGSTGISADNGLISNCTAESNGNAGLVASRVEHSFSMTNGSDGISGDAIFDCSAIRNSGNGIRGASVIDCTSSENDKGGIIIVAAFATNNGGQLIRGCSVIGNGLQIVDGPAGIESFGDCIIENNTIRSNYHGGINCGPDSVIRNNQVLNNSGDGIIAETHCEIRGNLVSENWGIGIQATTSVIESNTIFGNQIGIVAANAHLVSGNVLATNDTDYEFSGNCNLDLLVGQLPFEVLWPCQITLTRDAMINGSPQIGAAIVIAANNVEFDLGGHAIEAAFPISTGVLVSGIREGVVLRNGEINGFVDGVHLGSAIGAKVEDIRSINNSNTGITAGQRNTVTGCVAFDNGVIGIQSFPDTTITGCRTDNNTQIGLLLSTGCTLRDHVARENGIGIYGDSENRIEDSMTASNTTGYQIAGAGNVIVRNSSSGDGQGYMIPTGNTFGPIITGGAGEILSTNPWANFEQ